MINNFAKNIVESHESMIFSDDLYDFENCVYVARDFATLFGIKQNYKDYENTFDYQEWSSIVKLKNTTEKNCRISNMLKKLFKEISKKSISESTVPTEHIYSTILLLHTMITTMYINNYSFENCQDFHFE
jgi:hypothetical protein